MKRVSLSGATTVLALLGLIWLAAPASAICSHLHGDPVPGYTGPLSYGLQCHPAGDMTESDTWIVPATVTQAEFSLYGASDPATGSGGSVKANLPVTPGSTITLQSGGKGAATEVSLAGTPLLVAGGGNRAVPNYVSPGATAVTIQDPGVTPLYMGANGSIWVAWKSGGGGGEKPGEPETHDCVVPALKGKRPFVARQALLSAHCRLGTVVRRSAARSKRGRVISQKTPAGTVLTEGTAVDIVVGRSPYSGGTPR